MPYRDPDPSDPSVLVGVAAPGTAESMREMARVFADEFARMGTPPERILWLFHNPFYAGAHAALRALGAQAIRETVAEAVARWPVVAVIDAPPSAADSDELELLHDAESGHEEGGGAEERELLWRGLEEE